MSVLQLEHVAKKLGRHEVLRDVDLVVDAGDLVAVVGENGAGKSTLLRTVIGDLTPDAGHVRLDGTVGYCPQESLLNGALTVTQHLDLFEVAYRRPCRQRALELVGRLGFARYLDSPVAELSGGTRQKLNLTLALMHDPALLLLDEPYQGFDWDTYLRFWDLTEHLRDRGTAIVVITHLVFEQSRFDRLMRLDGGRLAPESRPPDDVPDLPVHQQRGASGE